MDGYPSQVPCPHCGWSPGPREVICASCSALLGRRGEPIFAAGRARRIFSHIVDGAVQSIPALLIAQVLDRELDGWITPVISVAIWFALIAALSGRAQSPGKIMLGTRIRMADGSAPSRRTVILREFLWWQLISLPGYLALAFGTIETVPAQGDEPETVATSGLWWLVFVTLSLLMADALALLVSPSRQALHDRVFGTMIERVLPGGPPVHAPHMPDRDPRDPPPAPPEAAPPDAGLPEAREAPPPPPPPRRPQPPPLPEGAQAALDELDRSRPHLTQSQYERRRRQIMADHGIDADA